MRAIQVDASGFIQKPPGITGYIKGIAPSPLEQFLKTGPETPFLAVDLSEVKNKYEELQEYFPEANIFYAVKANPSPEIVDTLAGLGSNFDAASLSEISLCMERGIHPGRISFGNTIKKSVDIARAFDLGVRQFVFDSESELE